VQERNRHRGVNGTIKKLSLKETVGSTTKVLKEDEPDVNLYACVHSTYNTLRKLKPSDKCPYEAFSKINEQGKEGGKALMTSYHKPEANGKISAR